MARAEHVIWAWDERIFDLKAHGLSVAEIRAKMRDEWHLSVGEASIREVLKTMPKDWVARGSL